MCPSGLCLKLIPASFNTLNSPLKGCFSLLTRMAKLVQGASSREPDRDNNPATKVKPEEVGQGVACALAACV